MPKLERLPTKEEMKEYMDKRKAELGIVNPPDTQEKYFTVDGRGRLQVPLSLFSQVKGTLIFCYQFLWHQQSKAPHRDHFVRSHYLKKKQ